MFLNILYYESLYNRRVSRSVLSGFPLGILSKEVSKPMYKKKRFRIIYNYLRPVVAHGHKNATVTIICNHQRSVNNLVLYIFAA